MYFGRLNAMDSGVGSALALALVLGASPLVARAAVIHVPADRPTIQAGLNAALSGDQVLVAPGTYAEELQFPGRRIRLTGDVGNPAAVVLQAPPGGTGITLDGSLFGAQVVEGLTLRGGLRGLIAGIGQAPAALEVHHCVFEDIHGDKALKQNSGRLDLHDCVFRDNTGLNGTAVNTNGNASIRNNRFSNNRTLELSGGGRGAGIYAAAVNGPVDILGNRFEDQVAFEEGGALYVNGTGAVQIRGNLFARCAAPLGEAMGLYGRQVLVESNTIVDSGASTGGAALFVDQGTLGGSVTITRNIVMGGTGVAVFWLLGDGSVTCNDLFGNAGGGLAGVVPAALNNFSADPLFCGAGIGDYTLRADSPCRQFGGPCGPGLVGAFDAGCQAVPVAVTSWGSIKALYAH